MNSRRLMGYPRVEDHAGQDEIYHIFGTAAALCITAKLTARLPMGVKPGPPECFRHTSAPGPQAELQATQQGVSVGRVEDGRGSLGHSATLRFPSPLIEPDVPN